MQTHISQKALQLVSTTCQLQLMFPPVPSLLSHLRGVHHGGLTAVQSFPSPEITELWVILATWPLKRWLQVKFRLKLLSCFSNLSMKRTYQKEMRVLFYFFPLRAHGSCSFLSHVDQLLKFWAPWPGLGAWLKQCVQNLKELTRTSLREDSNFKEGVLCFLRLLTLSLWYSNRWFTAQRKSI